MDKSAYKVGTIDADDFFTEGAFGKFFTYCGYEGEAYEHVRPLRQGELYSLGTCTGKYELVTLEDLATGEVHVWGVKFETTLFSNNEVVTDVMLMEEVVIEYNNDDGYGDKFGYILDWPTLKYYRDLFDPADYLE